MFKSNLGTFEALFKMSKSNLGTIEAHLKKIKSIIGIELVYLFCTYIYRHYIGSVLALKKYA